MIITAIATRQERRLKAGRGLNTINESCEVGGLSPSKNSLATSPCSAVTNTLHHNYTLYVHAGALTCGTPRYARGIAGVVLGT